MATPTLNPAWFGNFDPNANPTAALGTLYQDYLGRAPDPSGMSTFSASLQGLQPGSQQYSNTLGQIGMDLFNSPEGQQYAPTAPWYSAYKGGAWGWNPAGPGQVNVPTLAGGGTTMPATPQAVNAASTLGVPVNATTGSPINPPANAPPAAPTGGGSGSGGGGGGMDWSQLAQQFMGGGGMGAGGGYNPMDTFSSLLKSLPSAGGPAPGAPVTPITGQPGYMNQQSMSPYNIPSPPGIPGNQPINRSAGPAPITAQGLSSGLPLGYLSARAGGS